MNRADLLKGLAVAGTIGPMLGRAAKFLGPVERVAVHHGVPSVAEIMRYRALGFTHIKWAQSKAWPWADKAEELWRQGRRWKGEVRFAPIEAAPGYAKAHGMLPYNEHTAGFFSIDELAKIKGWPS